jgi:hypothetical protein
MLKIFRKQKKSSHSSLLKRSSMKEMDPAVHAFTTAGGQKTTTLSHVASGLRTPPSGIVAVRWGNYLGIQG